jgi:hypothetical protein
LRPTVTSPHSHAGRHRDTRWDRTKCLVALPSRRLHDGAALI